jgi:hypothetical protein
MFDLFWSKKNNCKGYIQYQLYFIMTDHNKAADFARSFVLFSGWASIASGNARNATDWYQPAEAPPHSPCGKISIKY